MPPTDPPDVALAQYGVLEAPPSRDLQALVDLAALVCDVPHAAVNLITSDHQHQVAAAGIDPSVCSREDSMCAAVLEDPSPVVVPDARHDTRFEQNPFVTGALGEVRFYASVPLTTPSGTTFGRLCVFDEVPHELPAQRTRVLETLAARVVDVLELRLRTAQLQRSNELLTLFAAQVAHDLRSPLTAVLANSELLAGEPAVLADPDVAGLVDATIQAGHRMNVLMRSILEFAQVGAQLRVREVDLGRIVEHVVADLTPVISARRAEVRHEGLPLLKADADQLYVVMLNLVSNAVKFTPPTTVPVVDVRAERRDGRWWVSVSDNGRGVRGADRDALFDLYARGDRSVEGSGIGLALVRRAVDAHGGEIGIDDAPEGGTKVWFTLPAA
jgi:signal transduction histidine kinase